MAHKIRNDDHDLLQWTREFSNKKIDMTVPRLRIQDYMQEDPDRWIINTTLNRLKSSAMQKYVKVEEDGTVTDLMSLNYLEQLDEEVHERIESEIDISQYSYPSYDITTIDTPLQSPIANKSNSLILTAEDEVDRIFREDTLIARDFLELEIDKRVNEYLQLENPDQKYYSSTVKVFSDSSVSDSDEEEEPVELKKLEDVYVQTQTETLQDILLTPVPGPGFRMAQVAHPDDLFEHGRRLPSVYFIQPRVRIFSDFPHCQQFWCRQGYPIPVPPPSKRNTFCDSRLLSTHHPKAKMFPFRVRSYKVNMLRFLAEELIFVVEGRNIFVTGEKRKGNDVIRTVTEEICLPIDLDLNYLRVARTNEGEIIFEELWEYDSNAKAN